MKTYLNLLGFPIPSYGFMIVIGVVCANILAFFIIRKRKFHEKSMLDYNDFLIIEAYCILGGFLGAKFLYVLVTFHEIDWKTLLTVSGFNLFMQTGFVFYGGLIGGIVAALLAGKIHKIKIDVYFNEFIFLIPFIHGCGRIGCFLAGCCYGVPYEGIGAVVFPKNSFALSGVKLFPVQLIEAILLFCLFFIMIVIKWKYKSKHMVEWYCLLYAILRFVLEFFRYDAIRGEFFRISTSQWISLAMIVGVLLFGQYNRRVEKH